MSSPERVVKFVETMLKLNGTNYSQVASKLKGKNGKPMSRQTLFRMVKNGTISFQNVLDIADLLGDSIEISDGRHNGHLKLEDVKGDRLKRKIKGVQYDTDKMFLIRAYKEDGKVKKELCWEPVTDTYVMVHYFGDDGKKYPYMEIADRWTD